MNTFTKIALSAILSFFGSNANALLIDDFSSGAITFSVAGAGNDGGSQMGTMLGGEREIDIAKTSGLGTSSVTVDTTGTGVLEIENDNEAISEVVVAWDFPAIDFIGFVASDRGIFISLFAPISGAMELTFEVSDGTNASSIDGSFADGFGDDIFLAFSGFTGFADLSAISEAALIITSLEVGLGVQIDLIEERNNVTEPAILSLMGLGFGLLGFARRKA